jgi:hypothetical protein
MTDDQRRPEYRICRDTDHQEDRNHDRRNEIFHGVCLNEFARDRHWPFSDAAALDHNKLDSTAAPRARQPNKIIA